MHTLPTPMFALFCLPIAALAAAGFLASGVVSVSFWLGAPVLPAYHDLLFKGIFVVHIPTVLLMVASAPRQRAPSWKEHLRGAPAWVMPAFVAVFAYAIVNFFLVFFGMFDASGDNFFRVGSSHAMAFYFAAFALNLAAYGRRNDPPPKPCARGHDMPIEASFCPTCGAARAGAARARDA